MLDLGSSPNLSTRLIVDEKGTAISQRHLHDRFTEARTKAKVDFDLFQFRDLRAKAGTDKTENSDIREAQKQLGYTSVTMTEHYVRDRIGQKVNPTR